ADATAPRSVSDHTHGLSPAGSRAASPRHAAVTVGGSRPDGLVAAAASPRGAASRGAAARTGRNRRRSDVRNLLRAAREAVQSDQRSEFPLSQHVARSGGAGDSL